MFIRKNDSGRSIVEMLGVLAIMGVITVMGIAGYSQAIGKINRNNTVEQITRLAQEVRSLFASRTTYNSSDSLTSEENYDIGTELLKKMGYNMSAPFGGDYTVKSFGFAGNNPGFTVTLTGVPQADCLYFNTMSWTDVLQSDKATPGSSAYFGANGDGSSAVTGTECTTLNTMSVYFR